MAAVVFQVVSRPLSHDEAADGSEARNDKIRSDV